MIGPGEALSMARQPEERVENQLSFNDAVKRLARFGIRGEEIYLIDLVLLVEMAWVDGHIQDAEVDILFKYLKAHVRSINRLAGCKAISEEVAVDFVEGLLHTRPDPELLEAIRSLVADLRIYNVSPEDAHSNRMAILNGCLDIAASSVTTYPYGLTERFTAEEKEYYHKIQEILSGNP